MAPHMDNGTVRLCNGWMDGWHAMDHQPVNSPALMLIMTFGQAEKGQETYVKKDVPSDWNSFDWLNIHNGSKSKKAAATAGYMQSSADRPPSLGWTAAFGMGSCRNDTENKKHRKRPVCGRWWMQFKESNILPVNIRHDFIIKSVHSR